jgi:hypothetical protein
MSATTGGPRPASSADTPTVLGEADDAVVRLVHLEHEARRRVGSSTAAVVGRAGCGWWCPPPPDGRPTGHDLGDPEAAADLDQLAPRHHHPRPAASAASTSSTAAAPLLTTMAASAPQAGRAAPGVGLAGAPLAGGEVELEVGVALVGAWWTATGARPRLVCSSTPVALTTGCRSGAELVGLGARPSGRRRRCGRGRRRPAAGGAARVGERAGQASTDRGGGVTAAT